MRNLLFILVCTYLPYGCEADCNCINIARYKQGQWEYLLQSELDLGTPYDDPIIYYLGGCCAAYRELIDYLEYIESLQRD